MVKVKVIIPFRDKYTNKEYKSGDIVEFPVKRINEIIKKNGNYIELVDEEKTTKV